MATQGYLKTSKNGPGVRVNDGIPRPCTVTVEEKDSVITVEVAPAAPEAAQGQPIDSLTNDKTKTWVFTANTMIANLEALASLGRFMQNDIKGLNRHAWEANIAKLIEALDNSVTACNKLCDDTNMSLVP